MRHEVTEERLVGTSSGHELPVDLRQGLGQFFGVRDQGECALAEQPWEPAFAVAVDGDAEDGMASAAGFQNCHAAVLDPVAAFVMVKVVGFAVGDDKKKPTFPRLFRQKV